MSSLCSALVQCSAAHSGGPGPGVQVTAITDGMSPVGCSSPNWVKTLNIVLRGHLLAERKATI